MIHSLPANPGLFFPRSSGEIVRSHLPSFLPPSPPSCQDLFSFPGLFHNMSSMMETWQFQSKQQPREEKSAGSRNSVQERFRGFRLHLALEQTPSFLSLPPSSAPPKSLCVAQNISFAFLISLHSSALGHKTLKPREGKGSLGLARLCHSGNGCRELWQGITFPFSLG